MDGKGILEEGKEDFPVLDCPGRQARIHATVKLAIVGLLVGNSGAPSRAGAVRETHGRISRSAHLDMRWVVCLFTAARGTREVSCAR